MDSFRSLKRPLLSNEVENQLKLSILKGAFSVGERLPSERELVEQFNVSRITVRSALRGLQKSGLIRVKQGRYAGAYVCELDSTPITENLQNLIKMRKVNFSHLMEIRLYTEPNFARNAAMHCTAEHIDTLKHLLDSAEAALNTSRRKARLLNVQFHNEVAKLIDNALVTFFSESILQVFSAMIIKKTHTRLDKKGIKKLILEHRSILEAIAQRNPKMAHEMTTEHLIKTYHMYSKIMKESHDENFDKRINSFMEI